jgi:hypothetical protein
LSATIPGKRKSRGGAEETASVEQIERYQEQIIDLEARCTARQEQIDEVSFILLQTKPLPVQAPPSAVNNTVQFPLNF